MICKGRLLTCIILLIPDILLFVSPKWFCFHECGMSLYNDVIMSAMASQNHQSHDCLLRRYSGAAQRKHQSSASLAFVRGIRRWPMNSPHKGPVTRKMFITRDTYIPCRIFFLKYFCLVKRQYRHFDDIFGAGFTRRGHFKPFYGMINGDPFTNMD